MSQDNDTKREAILDAATARFIEKGFTKTSMSEIAKEAGVTKSLIHHHFDHKERLWNEVKMRMLMPYFEEQAEILARESEGVKMFTDSFASYFRYLRANPACMRFFMWDMMEKPRDDDDMGDQLCHLGVARLREGQEQGHMRQDMDPEFMLIAFFCLLQHWFNAKPWFKEKFHPLLDKFDDVDEAFFENMIKLLERGIAPRPDCPPGETDAPSGDAEK